MSKTPGHEMLSSCIPTSMWLLSTRQDPPLITDIIAKVALEGKTISISGRSTLEGATVEIFNAEDNVWRPFQTIVNGAFSNDAVPASYTSDYAVLSLRLRVGNDARPEEQVKTTPLTGAIKAVWADSNKLVVSGQATPPKALVLANTRDRGLVPIESVSDAGDFNNPGLTASFLWDDNLLQICVRNGDKESDPVSALVDVPVRGSLFLSDVEAERAANESVTLRATVTAGDGNIEVFAQRGSDSQWQSIGLVTAGRIELTGLSTDLLWDTETLRVQLRAGTLMSTSVDATLGWAQSRAFYVKATLDPHIERIRLQRAFAAADIQPTGYYATKGVAFTVFLAQSAATVEICIGTPLLFHPENPGEDPSASRCHVLKPGENTIPADELGGAIHVRYLQTNANTPPPDVHLVLGETTRPMAWYLDGRTTHQQWRTMLNAANAPIEAQMVSDRVVIVGLTKELISWLEEDPHSVLAAHHALFDLENDIAGLDSSSTLHVPSQLRLYAVRSRDNFYPRAYHGGIAIPGTFQEQLFTRMVKESWMLAHEYGHHQQLMWDDNLPAHLTEVVVNLYSLAAWRKGGGEPDETFRLSNPEIWEPIKKYLALPRAEKTYTGYQGEDGQPIPFMSMAPFDQIRRGLGSNFIRNWHKQQRENPLTEYTYFAYKKSMILNACRAASLNLTDFFADWGILKEDETDRSIWEEARALSFAPPASDMTAIPIYVRNDPDDEWVELSDVTIEFTPDGKAAVKGSCSHKDAIIGVYSADEQIWKDISDVKDGRFENLAVPASYFNERRSLKLRGVIAGLHSVEARFPIQPQFIEATAKRNAAELVELRGTARPALATIVAESQKGSYPIASVQANGAFQNLNLPKGLLWDENTLRLWVRNGEGVFEPTVGPFMIQIESGESSSR